MRGLRRAIQKPVQTFLEGFFLPRWWQQFWQIKSRTPGLKLSAAPCGFKAMSADARPLKPLIAVCQTTSIPNKDHNMECCSRLIREAAQRGACIVFLPEAFDFIGSNTEETLSLAEPLEGDHVQHYAGLARDCGVWLSLGGFHERGSDWESTHRIYNCHLLLDPKGNLAAAYRKTHLCDVELEGRVSMKESAFTNPGLEIVSPVNTPAGKVGLAICYDLRFPEMSLALAQEGAEILTYPSAFTVTTGSAHWEVLLRARAIETQSYVVAAAQTGKNHEKRTSYGHAMIVDPWGSVIAQCQEGPGVCYAEIDLAYLRRIRQEIPVFHHRRTDLYGRVAPLKSPVTS
ncbi:deaminated glutathione amidase isoform X2 [Sphaerodactylus townsendi]|uniref:deaminated glutathione amidase isoform X2 n=1 Tax=Sphaerodactylus townsendi TaxID=933632 RepID=UPI0020263756|nr:deaminated glutathione amidase isoform X2 [Sphaerodactylus townsendi]